MGVEIMNRTEEASGVDKETLYMLGGIALVIVGAGEPNPLHALVYRHSSCPP